MWGKMSADNIIYIKKEEGKWLVWEQGFSDDDPRPPKDARSFEHLHWAEEYAFAEELDHFVEYGVSGPFEVEGMTIKKQLQGLHPGVDGEGI